MDLLTQFKNYIKKENLIEKNESIILGVSGGPDSLTMLDLFSRIKDEFKLELIIFHLNHLFREEAREEAIFVENLAGEYGIKAIIEEFDVPKFVEEKACSPEEGARKIRFELLSKWAEKYDIKRAAVAHNKDDLVETVFLNLFRGTGLKGLTGITPVSRFGNLIVIHPLLNFLRVDIESYCEKRNLKPRLDPSNKSLIYTRNKIRNRILPQIEEEINPALKKVVYRMASNIRKEEEFLAGLAHKYFLDCLLEKEKGKVVLSIKFLRKKEAVLRRRIIKNAIESLQGNVIDLYAVHYKAVEELIISGQTGKIVILKDNIQARKSYNQVIFEKEETFNNHNNIFLNLGIPAVLECGNYLIKTSIIKKDDGWRNMATNKDICLCDLDSIEDPLVVRNRRDGDYFYPFGMSGSKKIKDFFIDEKIAIEERDRIPIITDNTGKIIWIAGYRADDRFKVSDTTTKILKIRISVIGGD